MKVHELIELLQDQDPDLDVHFSYNYGDHWRTEVAPTVDTVDVAMIVYSDYHQMDRTIDDDSDEDEVRRVVVLK
jgi:hypothetical protein